MKLAIKVPVPLIVCPLDCMLKIQGIYWGEYGQEQERQDELTLANLLRELEDNNE